MLLNRRNKMAWFTGFPVNAVKSTLVRREDLCKAESNNMSETSDLPIPSQTSTISEPANNTGHNPLWNEVKFIDHDPHWYTRRVKEAIPIRLHPNNINKDSAKEIPEAWMSKIKKHNNRRTVRQWTTEGTAHRNSTHRNAPITAEHPA